MITRLSIKSLVTDKPISEVSLLSLNDYEDYLNPLNYTSDEEYMSMYMESRLHANMGVSYTEFMNNPIDKMFMMCRVSRKESKRQEQAMSNVKKKIGDMIDGV